MAKKTLTIEQQAAKDARRDAFRKLAAEISAMTPEQRAAVSAKMIITTIEGRALSMFNNCLVASQCPNATIVGGFRQWLAAGRCVRKGQHGLTIWVPLKSKDETETKFIAGAVFDVSQTDIVEAIAA